MIIVKNILSHYTEIELSYLSIDVKFVDTKFAWPHFKFVDTKFAWPQFSHFKLLKQFYFETVKHCWYYMRNKVLDTSLDANEALGFALYFISISTMHLVLISHIVLTSMLSLILYVNLLLKVRIRGINSHYCLLCSKIRRLQKVLHEADKVWRETMDAVYLTKTFMWSAISPGEYI